MLTPRRDSDPTLVQVVERSRSRSLGRQVVCPVILNSNFDALQGVNWSTSVPTTRQPEESAQSLSKRREDVSTQVKIGSKRGSESQSEDKEALSRTFELTRTENCTSKLPD